MPASPHYWRILAFSPDGALLAGAAGDAVGLWDVESGHQQAKLIAHEDSEMKSVAFSSDGVTVAVGHYA